VIRVGPAGWSYPDWSGPVYPTRKPKGFHPLRFLAPFVDCVEVNSTFYALPEARSAGRWVELVADRPDFRFLVKVHQDFTHEPWTPARPAEARAFREGIEPIRASGRLSALLVQLPVTFVEGAASWERLERIAEAFPDTPRVLEVRHRTWFEPARLERLGRLGWSVAHIDLPAAKDHPPETFDAPGPLGYLRLHGRNARAWFSKDAGRDQRYDWLYSPTDVSLLADRARAIAARQAETYVITNNHFGGKGLANALEMKAFLSGRPVPAPDTIVAAFPELRDLVTVVGQPSLF
jgi:uncharacterized protein YecE (DUF72 family)